MSTLAPRPSSIVGLPEPVLADWRPSPWVRPPAPPVSRSSWLRRYGFAVGLLDLVGVFVGASVAALWTGGDILWAFGTSVLTYPFVTVAVALLWSAALTRRRVYGVRVFGAGTEEYRRIIDVGLRVGFVVAATPYLAGFDLSRAYAVFVTPIAVVWSLLGHWLARRYLHRRRRRGHCQVATLLVGSPSHVRDLVGHLHRFPYVGFRVVGACTGTCDTIVEADGDAIPVVASPAMLVEWLRQGAARSVIVADATVLHAGDLRQFAWQLEGTGVDLMVAPSVTGVAGPRISVRPVEGLPLLHLEEPRFDGATRLIKGLVERTAAVVALLATSPVIAAAAVAVRLTSKGPILYRAKRVGKDGAPFDMLKLRTMVDGADQLRGDLASGNEHGDDPLFKMRDDPRVTPVGRVLRRLSIDELPQLLHVVSGRMAVVGPRPPSPDEVARYTDDAWRRLMVRPGVTGLWQVSGRSSLPWIETLRLDLYYVDNWSLSLDLVIVAKTFNAVIKGSGAY